MKKVLIGVGVLLVLILAGVVIAPSFIDWNQYRDELAAWVEERTGRQLDIAGGLSLSVLPTPRLVASDVTFANDPDGSADHMVRMDELAVRVALGPLLGGTVRVESVKLVRPSLVLEVLPNGRGNWTFRVPAAQGAAGGPVPPAPGEAPPPAPSGEEPAEGLAIALERLSIEEGSILWRDTEGTETRIDSITGDIAAESLQGPFVGDLAMTLRGSRIEAGLRTGRFTPDAASTPVTVTLVVPEAGSEVRAQGRVAGLGQGTAGATFEGSLTAESPSLARTLAAVQGVEPAPPLDRPFRLAGTLQAGRQGVALDGMTLRLGETEGSGGASLALVEPARLDVALAFTRIDLDALLREARAEGSGIRAAATTPPPTVSPSQAAAAEPPPVPGTAPTAPAQALVPALPADLTGSIDVTADVITWHGGIVRSAAVSASLADGEVTLNKAGALLPGSSEINAFGFLDTRTDPPAVDGTVEVKSSSLRGLLEWLGVDVAAVPADRLRHFNATAAVQGTAAEVAVPSLDGVLDTTRFQGAAALRPLQERPSFGLSLAVDALNLDAYLPRQGAEAAPAPAEADPQPAGQGRVEMPAPPGEPSAPPPLFADLAVLNAFDANIKARAGVVTYRGEEVRDARLDMALVQGRATFGETVAEDLAGSRVGVSGALGGFGGTPTFDGLTITLRSDDPAPLARVLGLELPAAARGAAPVDLSATLTGDLSRLAVTTTNRLAGGSFTAEGAVADPLGTVAVDLAVVANHDNLVALARRLGVAYEPRGGRDIGPLALTGQLSGGAEGITLSGLTLRAGPTTLTGQLAVTPSEPVPTVVASLAADRLPVDMFLPAERQAAVERVLEGVVPAAFGLPSRPVGPASAVRPVQAGAQRWSREPLDLEWLDAVNLDLALTAQTLSFERWQLAGADIAARLAEGALTIPKADGTLFGGPLTLTATVARTPEGAASLAVQSSVRQMDVGAALEALQGERAARGRMNFTADVTATGQTEYALVSSLRGKGDLSLDKVDMRRVENAGGSALASVLAPLRALDRLAGAVGGDSYGVDVRGAFDVADGVLVFAPAAPLTISSNLYNGSLHGAAALPAWTVRADGEVRLAQNALTALLGSRINLSEVMPVALSGPLDKPDVRLGTGRQTEPVKPEKALRDMLKQALPEEVRGLTGDPAPQEPTPDGQEAAPTDQQEQAPQKPEKVLRDTLKNLLFR